MSDHEGVVNTVSNREGVLKTRCKSCDVLKRSVAIVQATAVAWRDWSDFGSVDFHTMQMHEGHSSSWLLMYCVCVCVHS